MSKVFSKDEFNRRLTEKCPFPQPCPFCGKTQFVVVDHCSQLSVQGKLDGIEIGRAIPCGIVICQECGHVNLFSLGFLGMITKDGGVKNGEKN